MRCWAIAGARLTKRVCGSWGDGAGCGGHQATLEAFRKISKDGQAVSDKGNYRNLQTLGSRQIYRCSSPLVLCSPRLCAAFLVPRGSEE